MGEEVKPVKWVTAVGNWSSVSSEGSSENLCGIQLRTGKAEAFIQWLLLPPHSQLG